MDLIFEIGLSIITLVIGIIVGWLTNWYFYRRQQKESKAIIDDLKFLVQKGDAEIRSGNDKRGKIVKRPDGTIAIEWQVGLPSSVTVSAKPQIEVKRKEE
jgi:preprotein translocase subunit YajC